MLDRRQGAAEFRDMTLGKQLSPGEMELRVEAGIAVANPNRGERRGYEEANGNNQGRCCMPPQLAQGGVRETV
jgi:hypothetical protein